MKRSGIPLGGFGCIGVSSNRAPDFVLDNPGRIRRPGFYPPVLVFPHIHRHDPPN
jgi:hypothetical protein